jgi:8-oxo-dGTP pyrophosphatase MutT (NUDIX family)
VPLSNLVRDENGWETKSRNTRYVEDHLEVTTEEVKSPSHLKTKSWTIVYRKRAVVIAALTREGKFLLVQQERIPIREAIWEMPAGQIDESLEPTRQQIETTALREMREETGYQLADDGKLIAFGDFFSSPGFTDEHMYLFLARPVEACSEDEADQADSILALRAVTAEELRQMIAGNEIRDANTLSICARLAARGFLSLSPP